MFSYIKQAFKKFFSKNWGKIFSSLSWIYSYVKKYRSQIAVYTGLGLFMTAFSLLGTVVSKNLINTVTGYGNASILWAAIAYAALGIFQIFIGIITEKISLKMQLRVHREIQEDVFDRIISTDWESVSDFTTGDLLVRADRDAKNVSSGVLGFLPKGITAVFRFLGAFIIVCIYDPWMAIIALAGAPVTFFISHYRYSKMKDFQKESHALYSKSTSFREETFKNIHEVKAFGLTETFSKKMKNLQNRTDALYLKQFRYQSVSRIIMSLTALLVSYSCYGFAIFRLWHGDIYPGTMVLFISLASSLTGAFDSIVSLIPTAINSASSADRIKEIVDLPKENLKDAKRAEKILEESERSGIFIKADNLAFAYKNGKIVFKDSSVKINSGEIIALSAPSGSGKTTALRLLLGLLTPSDGTLSAGANGGDCMEISPSTRCLFSYVPQVNTVFSGTLAENLRLVNPEATDEQLTEALDLACALDFTKDLKNGLGTVIGEGGQEFSEGQKQRLSIARAVLKDSPVLILDEATSALDYETEKKVLTNIIKKNPARIIIVAAHRTTVFSFCDRIFKIENGYITVSDSKEEE